MTEDYDELIRRSTKGDKLAMEELFAIAENAMTHQHFEDAARAFRDAAISYRISAFRNRSQAQDAEARARWVASVRDIYANWVDQNPQGLRSSPRQVMGVDNECIRQVVVEQLLAERNFINLFRFLEEELSERGVEFYSPGGSVQRRVIHLLAALFGLATDNSGFLQQSAIRVGLDQIADEVERRCRGRSVESKSGM